MCGYHSAGANELPQVRRLHRIHNSRYNRSLFAGVAQSVEQLICNQPVGGSIPLASSMILKATFKPGSSQLLRPAWALSRVSLSRIPAWAGFASGCPNTSQPDIGTGKVRSVLHGS